MATNQAIKQLDVWALKLSCQKCFAAEYVFITLIAEKVLHVT